jgi:hypothetical protein
MATTVNFPATPLAGVATLDTNTGGRVTLFTSPTNGCRVDHISVQTSSTTDISLEIWINFGDGAIKVSDITVPGSSGGYVSGNLIPRFELFANSFFPNLFDSNQLPNMNLPGGTIIEMGIGIGPSLSGSDTANVMLFARGY